MHTRYNVEGDPERSVFMCMYCKVFVFVLLSQTVRLPAVLQSARRGDQSGHEEAHQERAVRVPAERVVARVDGGQDAHPESAADEPGRAAEHRAGVQRPVDREPHDGAADAAVHAGGAARGAVQLA